MKQPQFAAVTGRLHRLAYRPKTLAIPLPRPLFPEIVESTLACLPLLLILHPLLRRRIASSNLDPWRAYGLF